MDTVIKIICENSQFYIGGNNCGYDDVLFNCCSVLINYIKGEEISFEEIKFLKDNFFMFNGEKEQDIEAVIDITKNTIYIENNFKIEEIKDLSFSEFENLNIEDESVLFSNLLTFEQFEMLFNLIKESGKKKVIINEKYKFECTFKK